MPKSEISKWNEWTVIGRFLFRLVAQTLLYVNVGQCMRLQCFHTQLCRLGCVLVCLLLYIFRTEMC